MYTSKLKLAATSLANKDPYNPFYKWLAGQEVTQEFLDKYPKSEGTCDEWSLQNDMSVYKAENDNIGSWIFLGNLIINGLY